MRRSAMSDCNLVQGKDSLKCTLLHYDYRDCDLINQTPPVSKTVEDEPVPVDYYSIYGYTSEELANMVEV